MSMQLPFGSPAHGLCSEGVAERIVVVQSQSSVQLCDCELPHTILPCPSLSPDVYLTHVHGVSDAIHLILCCALLLLPSIYLSIRVFSTESNELNACMNNTCPQMKTQQNSGLRPWRQLRG